MRKHLVNALLALVPIVLFNTAFAADIPVKPAVNFNANAMLNGVTSSLGHTGVVVKIQSAAIAKDGTITVRATIVDTDGLPLDRLGVTSNGKVSMSFIAAAIPAGQTQYVSYSTTVAKSTTNTNPNQIQAANDSGGAFTTNAIGDYLYTFKTKAPTASRRRNRQPKHGAPSPAHLPVSAYILKAIFSPAPLSCAFRPGPARHKSKYGR